MLDSGVWSHLGQMRAAVWGLGSVCSEEEWSHRKHLGDAGWGGGDPLGPRRTILLMYCCCSLARPQSAHWPCSDWPSPGSSASDWLAEAPPLTRG